MEKSPKRIEISVIIPNYNYARYLKECIDSCLNQEDLKVGYEVIVVDDCSTDNSLEVLKAYGNRINWVALPKNAGYSAAKNIGLQLAKGEFIAFLDADDMLTPCSLARRYEEFEKDPTLDMVHGRAWRYRDGKLDGYNKRSSIHAQCVMIHKSVFDGYGGFDENMRSKSDKLMWYKLGVHPRSPIKPKINAKKIKQFVALYRKHDDQMHKVRRAKRSLNAKINKMFEEKVAEYVRQES